jgi:hypothetical protein
MILSTTSRGRLFLTIAGAALGGLAAGALVPSLSVSLGALPARAAFGAILASVILLVRGARQVPARAAIVAAAGLLAALSERVAPGFGPAITGLGLGLVLAPDGSEGVLGRILRGCVAASGALLGAVAIGAVARSAPFATPLLQDASLGAALALGAAAGDLLTTLVLVPTQAPAELEEARAKASTETLPAVDMARSAYLRTCDAVRSAPSLDQHDRIEALATARELALATARSTIAAEEIARTKRSVAAPTRPGTELDEKRERVEATLDKKLVRARDDAARSATALAELALAVVERASHEDTESEDLAARARGLAFRLGSATDAPLPERSAGMK